MADEESAPLSLPRRRGPSHVEPDASLAARFGFVQGAAPELRVGLGLSIWPRARMGGLSLRAAFGRPLEHHSTRFSGSLTSTSLSAAGRVRWEPRTWLRIGGALGGLVDFTRLSGAAVGQSISTRSRAVPGLALELDAYWLALPWLRIGLRGGATWLVQTQRYRVRGDPVLELSRISYEAALVFGFGDHDP